jgi:hypothetical protein
VQLKLYCRWAKVEINAPFNPYKKINHDHAINNIGHTITKSQSLFKSTLSHLSKKLIITLLLLSTFI